MFIDVMSCSGMFLHKFLRRIAASHYVWTKHCRCSVEDHLLASKKLIRCFTVNSTVNTSTKEIKIPIEYGYVAAKEWGPPSGKRFVAIHGWQDNASSFDTLIPLLSPELHIIAIDLIGHGQSSHKPSGIPYSQVEFAYQLKHIAKHLEWEKFSIIGHSMGSGLGIVFASIFPDMVEKVIGIDLMSPITYPVHMVLDHIKASMDTQIAYEKKLKHSSPPVYTETEALRRIMEGTAGTLTEKSAKILMKRGTSQLGNGKLIFSRDIRVKNMWFDGYNVYEVMRAIVSNIKCELLLIKAKDSPIVEKLHIKEMLELYKRCCKRFEEVTVDGNHFVHLNNPERVAPHINAFLNKS